MTRQIIGLAGTFASGKDTLAHYLVQNNNFLHFSTSDMVRQEAMKKYGSIERPILHKTANELRHEKGAGILSELAITNFKAKLEERDDYSGLIVSGLRSIGEAKAIKKAGGVLIFVDAPAELRYQRMIERQRDGESKLTLEEFIDGEERELRAEDPNDDASFNILGIKDMADVVIINDKSLEDFINQAKAAIG